MSDFELYVTHALGRGTFGSTVAFRVLPPQDDPEIRRLVGDSPGWRVLYREPPGMRSLANVLFALLAIFALFIATLPALRAATRYFASSDGSQFASFIVGIGASAILVALLVGFALRARALDRAHEGVVRGTIEGLDVLRSSRFAQYLVKVSGTVVSLLPEIHAALVVGRETVIERDRQGTVKVVLLRD